MDPSNLDASINRWFASSAWEDVVDSAGNGCKDSLDFMEEVNEHMGSLCWHLSHNPEETRIAYELQYFSQLCDDFEVA